MPLQKETLRHERAVLASPYMLKAWLAYISHLLTAKPAPPLSSVIRVFERSVASLTSSYKLWRQYLRFVHSASASAHPSHPIREHCAAVAIRAARALPHCPVLWEEAVRVLTHDRRWTQLRGVVDEAVSALPVTLHARFWRFVVRAVLEEAKFLELGAHVLARARMLNLGGDGAVELFRVLRDVGKVDEAVVVLSHALGVDGFGGDDRRDLWTELVDVAVRNPGKCTSTDVPALVRRAIDRAEAEVGELWTALASLFARMAQFQDARAVYEEALAKVMTVRDFAVVFDAYAKFLESLVVAAMDDVEDEDGSSVGDDNDDDSDVDSGGRGGGNEDGTVRVENGNEEPVSQDRPEASDGNVEAGGETEGGDAVSGDDGSDSDLGVELDAEELMTDLEALANRRPMLLSDVWIRQNPHNVHEWHKRAGLFKKAGDPAGAVSAYTDSVRTIDPWRASHGRPHTLWIAFAGLYEKAGDLNSARKVFDKAVSNPEKFKAPDDLASVWCDYAEMELRRGSPELARAVLQRATSKPEGFGSRKFGKPKEKRGRDPRFGPKNAHVGNATAAIGTGAGHISIAHDYDLSSPAWYAWKSLRVWAFYADIVESIGTTNDMIDLYEAMLDSRVATTQTVLNGAAFLESRRHFEQSFRLMDRATTVFPWHDARHIWYVYLQKFSARYGGSQLERLRDLFEEALKAAPVKRVSGNRTLQSEHLLVFYMMYAKMEERFGLARHAMALYKRAAKAVLPDQQARVYRMYVVRASELFGVTRARSVYEDAIASMQKREDIMEFSMRYAKMETRMGEIDRARAIYAHGAEVADPRWGAAFAAYWSTWNAFELDYGSEDTFRDMLRVKRSVQMQNAGVHLVTSVASGAGTVEAAAAAESDRVAAKATADEAGDEGEGTTGPGGGAMAALERKVLQAQAAAKRDGQTTGMGNAEEIAVDLNDDDSEDSDDDSREAGDNEDEKGGDHGDEDDRGKNPGRDGQSGVGGQSHAGLADVSERDEVKKGKKGNIDFVERAVPEAVMSIAGIPVTGNHEDVDAGGKRKSGAVNGPERAPTALGAKEKLKRLKRA